MPDAKVLSSEEARVLDGKIPDLVDTDPAETADWLGSLDYILKTKGPERVKQLLKMLDTHARKEGVDVPMEVNTPYINTIPVHKQPAYPGNREIERRIKSIIRWNAMAMVQRGEQEKRRYRWSHQHLCLERNSLRSRLQPLLPWTRRVGL